MPGLGSIRMTTLVVSVVLALLAVWKRSHDLNELNFVHEQVLRANAAAAPIPSASVQQRLQREHRDALLTISQKENELRTLESLGTNATSLQDSIKHDVQRILLNASSSFSVGDTAWLQFEDGRERDVRTALAVDLLMLPIAFVGLVSGGFLWYVESERKRSASLKPQPK